MLTDYVNMEQMKKANRQTFSTANKKKFSKICVGFLKSSNPLKNALKRNDMAYRSVVFNSGQKMALRVLYVVLCPQEWGHLCSETTDIKQNKLGKID